MIQLNIPYQIIDGPYHKNDAIADSEGIPMVEAINATVDELREITRRINAYIYLEGYLRLLAQDPRLDEDVKKEILWTIK